MNMQEAKGHLNSNLPWLPKDYVWHVSASSTTFFDLPAISLMALHADPAQRNVLNSHMTRVRVSKRGITKRHLNKLIRKSQSLALEIYKTQNKRINAVDTHEITGLYSGGISNARTRWERFCDYMMEWD